MRIKCYINIGTTSNIKTGIQEAFNKASASTIHIELEYNYCNNSLDVNELIKRINDTSTGLKCLECVIELPNGGGIIMNDDDLAALMKFPNNTQRLESRIKESFTTYKSGMITHRGHKLIYQGDGPTEESMPVLTAELYGIWHMLYLLKTDGTIEEFDPPLEEVSYLDNKWNPLELEEYCENNDIIIGELFYEMLVGRWEIEVENNY